MLRGIHAGETQECDPLIEAGNLEIGIKRGSVFEILQTFFKELLVHVGATEVVEARGFSGIGLLLGNSGSEEQ